jgi:hypothetical protein
MISQPKFNISKFSGMSGDGGTFYIDGFNMENENGVMSVDESYNISEVVSNATTNFTNLGNIMSKIYIYSLSGSTLVSTTAYTLMFDGTRFYTTDSGTSNVYSGEIGGQTATGNYKPSKKPDLFQLPSGNILFTSSRHLGLIVRGLAKSGSGTTKIIDTDGRDLSTLGLSTVAPNNKVVNLKTGVQYTVTSITTTNSTNDTLNFSAGTEVSENDEFMAFAYTKIDFNYINGKDGDEVTIPNFAGQQDQEYWSRQINQYGNQYMISNGNYIALLANDEETFDATYKQAPVGEQIISFNPNSIDNVLVSSVSRKGKGHLLLWDGSSDGWQQILNMDASPNAVYNVGSGWMYLLDGIIYFTNGLNIEKMVSWPENNGKSAYNTTNFNAITSYNGVYYFCVEGSMLGDRSANGILVFNPNTGLTFFKTKSNGIAYKIPYCINVKTGATLNAIYSTNSLIEVAGDGFYNQVTFNEPSTDTKDFHSYLTLVDLGQETQIKQIWLNIKRGTKSVLGNRNLKNATISVNYGNNYNPILGYGKANVTSTTAVANVNGDIYPGVVGQEIEFLTGNVAGQRTFIQSIENAGTITETWVISPALSTTGTDCEYRAWGLKNAETKSITLDDISKPVMFNTNFMGDKLWLEIVVRGTANSFPVSINNIMIF